jgi:hypothetical protein
VLHLLGEDGPLMPNPSRVCRHADVFFALLIGAGVSSAQ